MRLSQGFLARSRRNAEDFMTDTCIITHPGPTTTDPETGLVTTATDTVYDGPCKVQTSGGLAGENTEGSAATNMGAVSLDWSLYLHLPYGTTGLRPGDAATITKSANPSLEGCDYRLISPQGEKSIATACRWNIKERG